jgi:hypothetical protein
VKAGKSWKYEAQLWRVRRLLGFSELQVEDISLYIFAASPQGFPRYTSGVREIEVTEALQGMN